MGSTASSQVVNRDIVGWRQWVQEKVHGFLSIASVISAKTAGISTRWIKVSSAPLRFAPGFSLRFSALRYTLPNSLSSNKVTKCAGHKDLERRKPK